MSKTILPAALVAVAIAASGLSATASAGYGTCSKADKMAKFAEIHGFAHPHAAASAEKPRLGVAIAAVNQADLDTMGLEYGVRIERVMPQSLAADIPLQPGDVVTAVGDRPAYSPERLQHLVGAAEGSTTIALTRTGQALKLPVDFSVASKPADEGKPALGVRIQNMTSALKEAFGAQGDKGVLIAQVSDGSAAAAAGLKAGDVVVAVDDQAVQMTGDVLQALSTRTPGDEVEVKILRDRAEASVTVVLGQAEHSMPYGKPYHWHGHKGHGKHGYGHPYHGGLGHGSWHGGIARDRSGELSQQGPF